MSATCPVVNEGVWLGPAGSLRYLDIPDGGYTVEPSLNENVHQLISGGVSVTRRPQLKRNYSLSYGVLDQDDVDLLMRIYLRALGVGPFVMVDPTWRNLLTLDDSVTGGSAATSQPWIARNSTSLLASTAVAPPVEGAGVLAWVGAGTTSFIGPGVVNGAIIDADPTDAVPLIPGQAYQLTLWMRTATGTANTTVRLDPRNGDGSYTTAGTATTAASLTTTWTRFTVAYTPGTQIAKYLVPAVTCSTAAAPTIYVSAAQIELADAPSGWNLGNGCPRVLFTKGIKLQVPLLQAVDSSITLAEV